MAILEALLPLDDERRVEMNAQIQLVVLSASDASLRDVALALNREIGLACSFAVSELRRLGSSVDEGRAEQSATELHAFLDGLAFQALLAPQSLAPEATSARLRAYLVRHLDAGRAGVTDL